MSLLKEQRLINNLKQNKNLQVIQIITTNENFERRFDGSISSFFKSLKNGLYTFQGVSNREYFRGISGVYFSLEDINDFEIIIVYDTSIKKLNRIQILTRLKKLLGLEIKVQFGTFDEYEPRIMEMLGIRRKTQTFGEYYFNTKKIT